MSEDVRRAVRAEVLRAATSPPRGEDLDFEALALGSLIAAWNRTAPDMALTPTTTPATEPAGLPDEGTRA